MKRLKITHFLSFLAPAAVLAVALLQLSEISNCYPDVSWDLKQFDRFESSYGIWIGQFSRFDFADTGVADPLSANGILSFPWLNFVIHGLSCRYLGSGMGFVAAELLVALAAFGVWHWSLRTLLPPDIRTLPLAMLAAAITTAAFSSTTDWLYLMADSFGLRPAAKYVFVVAVLIISGSRWIPNQRTRHLARTISCLAIALCGFFFQPGEIYSDRFPRPFVSQLALIPGFAMALKILSRGNASKLDLVLLATFGGLTLHMDFYGLLALGLLSAAAILRLTVKQGIATTARMLAWSTLPVLIFLTPFLITRLLEAPDLPARLGLRSGEPLYLHHFNISVGLALACAIIAGLTLSSRTKAKTSSTEWPIESLWFLLPLAYLLSSLILPLVTGKSIQMWHYLFLVPSACSLVFLLIAITGLGRLAGNPRSTNQRTVLWPCVLTALMVASVGTWLIRNKPGQRGVYNPSHQRLVSFQGGRNDLYAILEKAKSFCNGRRLVLGSTDYTANSFWSAWQGPVLTPNCCSTVLKTEELAYRTALLYGAAEKVSPHNIDFKKKFPEWLHQSGLGYHTVFGYSPSEDQHNFLFMVGNFYQNDPPKLRCDLLLIDKSNALGKEPPSHAILAEQGDYVLLDAKGLGWFTPSS